MTNPATETKSTSGCRPPRWRRVFCSSSRQFHRDTKLRSHLPGLVPSRQFHRDTKLTAVYRDWQKTRHRDPSCARQAPTATN